MRGRGGVGVWRGKGERWGKVGSGGMEKETDREGEGRRRG